MNSLASEDKIPIDKFRLSDTDVESLVKALFAAMNEEISNVDYFHDKAFTCILKLLLKTYTKIEDHIHIKDLKEYEKE